MKRRITSLLLVVLLVISVLPVTAFADGATDIMVKDATFYSSGSLNEIKVTFDWDSPTVDSANLILMREPLSGSDGTTTAYGDFTNQGKISTQLKFSDYDAAEDYDDTNGTFGFIKNVDVGEIKDGDEDVPVTMKLDDGTISLSKDDTYYVYLWVTFGNFYPDNLICVIQVKDGALQYTPGIGAPTYRNKYDSNAFTTVISKNKYNVTVNPGANMTHTSGTATQSNLTSSMVPVTYTANSGYYFPDTYSVATVNGIMVKRLDESRIRVYGTPSADATITLADATQKAPTHTCTRSTDWEKDAAQHWHYECTVSTCDKGNYNKKAADIGNHIYDDDLDAECNTCKYIRSITHKCTKSDWITNETHHWRLSCHENGIATANNAAQNLIVVDKGSHTYTDGRDPECNTCGYKRTIADDDTPPTGDITNIPMWGMLLFAGVALMYVQLTQRKREQF